MQGIIQISEPAQNRTKLSFWVYYSVSCYPTKQQQILTTSVSLSLRTLGKKSNKPDCL